VKTTGHANKEGSAERKGPTQEMKGQKENLSFVLRQRVREIRALQTKRNKTLITAKSLKEEGKGRRGHS